VTLPGAVVGVLAAAWAVTELVARGRLLTDVPP
jgi:hypothetical protein